MNALWGVILFIISSIGYFGQAITAFWPATATKLGLTEPEADVDPAFYADVRGEAIWDTAILWMLPVAGVLLVLNSPVWVYFGLVGGGMYLYFAGRGIVVRRMMQQHGIRIGVPETLKVAYIFLTLWGLAAFITIVMAIAALPLN
jgi:hypothetical protein